jgi:hypothetical protein
MTLGYNYDFESHLIVGKIVSSGGNVYAETSRYNYGPIFSLCLGLFYYLSSFLGNPSFAYRMFIVCFLTCFDIALSFLLYKKYKSMSIAALFFLNPVSIIITGYHNQFDVLASWVTWDVSSLTIEMNLLRKKTWFPFCFYHYPLQQNICCCFFHCGYY